MPKGLEVYIPKYSNQKLTGQEKKKKKSIIMGTNFKSPFALINNINRYNFLLWSWGRNTEP